MNIPSTILHPDSFRESQWSIECPHCHSIIGFDGIFDWGWVINAIREADPANKIMPMDFDGVVERHNHYLVFETKDVGKKAIEAQIWTLERLRIAKTFTVMQVWGKRNPEHIKMIWQNGGTQEYPGNRAYEIVTRWFRAANLNRIVQ